MMKCDSDSDIDDDYDEPVRKKPKLKSKRAAVSSPPETPTDSIAMLLEAWDHGQLSDKYIQDQGMFPPVRRALTAVLEWLMYDHLSLKYMPKVKDVPESAKLSECNTGLAKFYNVNSDQELIDAQTQALAIMQARLSNSRPTIKARQISPREG